MSRSRSKPHSKGRRAVVLTGVVFIVLAGVALFLSWDHLRFWWRFESLGPNEQGYAEYRHRETGVVMVQLPGGIYRMGRAEGAHRDKGGFGEFPQHEVELSPFLLAKYEISQGMWQRVMGNNPSRTKADDLPVHMVSWHECREFCDKTGLKLPTEAQWEYGCRATTEGDYSGTENLDDMGWSKENSNGKVHMIGSKQPNGFGLYDMHGNIGEWCLDVHNKDFYGTLAARRKDPVCEVPGSGAPTMWVFRGGSYWHAAWFCRSAARFGSSGADSYIGFRPAYYPVP